MTWTYSGLVAALCISLCASLSACNGQAESESAAPRSRVVAVKAKAEAPVDPEELCDVAPASGPKLSLPELAEGSKAPGSVTGRRWLNVWATWCKPCVEELPMLLAWKSRLDQQGVNVSLEFLSADESDQAVTAFAKDNPGAPPTLRVADPQALPTWLEAIGLDKGAPLPIHVLTDSSGKVVCVRAGAVDEGDYAPIKELLSR